MIGVTWVTSTIVSPSYSAHDRAELASPPASGTAAKLSPPGGATSSAPSHFACSSGSRSRASAKVRPSQSPKSVSISPSRTASGAPVACATASAVWRARRSGDVRTAVISATAREARGRVRRLRPPDRGELGVAVAGVAACRSTARSARAAAAAAGWGPRPARSTRSSSAASSRVPVRPSPGWPARRHACCARAAPSRTHVAELPDKRCRLARQRLHRRVLDLPAAGHLLDDQLGVHPHLDVGGAQLARALAARRSGRGTRRRCWWRRPSASRARPAPPRSPASSTTAP